MAEANLHCYPRREGRSLVLALEGTLDLVTAPQALETLQAYLAEYGPSLILDTSRVDFIDSRGVGALITLARAAREAGGAIHLPRAALPVRKILEACGLSSFFPTHLPDQPAAGAAGGLARQGQPIGHTFVGRTLAEDVEDEEEPAPAGAAPVAATPEPATERPRTPGTRARASA